MSFHFGSLLDWSLYCLHFLFLFLLFLHADALVFIFSALLLASLSSFFWPLALAFVRPVLLSALVSRLSPAPWLVSRRCSVSNGSAPMRLVGISSLEGFACAHLRPITAISSALSRIAGRFIVYLPVVNLAPRWEGGMVGVRNERQTHLPTPPVWTAPLRSSLSSPSRGIVARVL